MDLVLLSCPFKSNEDHLQREKIPAEILPFPLTAWLGLYMALKLHALMDRGGGENKKSCGGETLSDLKTLIRNKSE